MMMLEVVRLIGLLEALVLTPVSLLVQMLMPLLSRKDEAGAEGEAERNLEVVAKAMVVALTSPQRRARMARSMARSMLPATTITSQREDATVVLTSACSDMTSLQHKRNPELHPLTRVRAAGKVVAKA